MKLDVKDVEYLALLLFETDRELLAIIDHGGYAVLGRASVRGRRHRAWNNNEGGIRDRCMARARAMLVRHRRNLEKAGKALPPHLDG